MRPAASSGWRYRSEIVTWFVAPSPRSARIRHEPAARPLVDQLKTYSAPSHRNRFPTLAAPLDVGVRSVVVDDAPTCVTYSFAAAFVTPALAPVRVNFTGMVLPSL